MHKIYYLFILLTLNVFGNDNLICGYLTEEQFKEKIGWLYYGKDIAEYLFYLSIIFLISYLYLKFKKKDKSNKPIILFSLALICFASSLKISIDTTIFHVC